MIKKGVMDIHLCIENKSSLLYTNLVGTRGKTQHVGGHCGRDRMIVGFTTIYMQSASITTYVVSWNPAQAKCTRYSIM